MASQATKIALVGVGKIARDQHIPAIAESSDWELAAAVSRNASVEGVENYTDFAAMLEQRPDITVVSLCMPPVARYEYAIAALAAGRHVMMEKPPGATLSECHALQRAAERAGVTLFATWHSRAAHAVPDARDWLSSGALHKVHVCWKEDVHRWHPGQEWIWEAGGLGVFDPGINALSILTAILPQPVHLTSATLDFPGGRETPIASRMTFSGIDGADITAEFDWRQEGQQTWDITAETSRGSMRLADGGARLEVDGKVVSEGSDREYPNLYARMADLLRRAESDVDLSPMTHVADAFTLGKRVVVEPFSW